MEQEFQKLLQQHKKKNSQSKVEEYILGERNFYNGWLESPTLLRYTPSQQVKISSTEIRTYLSISSNQSLYVDQPFRLILRKTTFLDRGAVFDYYTFEDFGPKDEMYNKYDFTNWGKSEAEVISSSNPLEQAYTDYSAAHTRGDYIGYRAPSKELQQELDTLLGPFTTGPKEVYRALTAPSEDAIDFGKLGVYWSWIKAGARVYWGNHENNEVFVLTARVTPSDIDWLGTIEAYTKLVYSGEEEIRLKDRAEIDLVSVEKIGEDSQFEVVDVPEQRATANSSKEVIPAEVEA